MDGRRAAPSRAPADAAVLIRTLRSHAAGLTLPEVAVAAAVFLVVALGLLAVLGAARRTFERGEQATEQQQQTRSGFDLMTRRVRAAGHRVDPDGDPARPDEAIEGAWAGALFVRADYDGADPAASGVPEDGITGPFEIVTTGNDEIIGFVLRKADGSGGVDLEFEADVHGPATAPLPGSGSAAVRDGIVETVTIPHVHLIQTDPPYVLYRVTLNNDATSWGSGRFVTFAPVSDDVRSLAFRYEDALGIEIPPPGGAETAAAERRRIRAVTITLEGLTVDPDLRWSDPADPSSRTRRHRKMTVTTSSAPPNLGRSAPPAPGPGPAGPPGGTGAPGRPHPAGLAW